MSTATTYSVDSMCRVCLVQLECATTYDLFLLPDLAKTFTVCTSLLLEPQDGYPRNLCGGCYARLKDLDEFRQLCVTSVQRLKQMLENKVVDSFPVEVSNETELLLVKDEQELNTDYDPLLSHKLEIDNVEDVFKLLESVDILEHFKHILLILN